jgi:hypothetical protein
METFERSYLRLQPVQTVVDMLRSEQRRLAELAPHNGTVPGARAIADCRARIDALQANLDWRAAVNDPNQED